jgi:outer membrane immunogenic protein
MLIWPVIWGLFMRRLSLALISAVSAVAFTQNASAADLPIPAYSPPLPIAYNWTGFYVGLNAGGHWGKDDVTTAASVPNFDAAIAGAAAGFDAGAAGTNKPSGFFGGLQVGYNWQFYNFVVGLEGDVNGLTGSKSRSVFYAGPLPAAGDTFATSVESNFLATVRGRLGLTFDRALVYATGGLAVGIVKTTDAATVFGGTLLESVSDTTTRAGWTVGGGLEYAFTPNWSAKLEYLYVDLGSFDTAILCAPGPAPCLTATDITVHHKWTDNIARVGINYKFF